MVKANDRPPHPGAGTSRGGGSNHIFKTKTMSHSISGIILTPAETHNYKIFAFAHRGGPRHRSIRYNNEVDDQHVAAENMTILNHLQKLVKQGGGSDHIKKRKTNNNDNNEFEGLYVIDVNAEKIDLKKVASDGDDEFQSVLNEMTHGMVYEEQFLGVLDSLDGRWGSKRKRRKYVDAAVFANVLPVDWKILLSLRPRVRHPSLYCRRYVSPSGVHLNSCKDVAFYLKSQLLTTDTSPPKEVAMMQIDYDSQVDVESGALVPISSFPASKVHLFNENGKQIDLWLLASTGDDVFQSELNKMTSGMVREDEFLGFLKSLDGHWGSKRMRRKYVNAAVFSKMLPVKWKIMLSLRPRVRKPSLYCRRFVSPSGVHLNSCKDVAFYLKSQFLTTDTSPPEEVVMMQIDYDCQVDIESGALVPKSSTPASKEVELLEMNDLRNVPLYHLIECQYCKNPFTSMDELEYHLQKVHGDTIRRSHKDTLAGQLTAPRGLLLIREPEYPPTIIEKSVMRKTVLNKEVDPLQNTATSLDAVKGFPVNGEGSSSFPKLLNDPKKSSEEGKLKTRCMWCLVQFFREPVDAETLVSSSGFICPKCKEDAVWRFKNALSELTQHVGKGHLFT